MPSNTSWNDDDWRISAPAPLFLCNIRIDDLRHARPVDTLMWLSCVHQARLLQAFLVQHSVTLCTSPCPPQAVEL